MAQITLDLDDALVEQYKKAIVDQLSNGGERTITIPDVLALLKHNFETDLNEPEVLAEIHCGGDCLEDEPELVEIKEEDEE